MAGVVPKFGIGAVRINSDHPDMAAVRGGARRVKVPAAPNGRYVGLVLLFGTRPASRWRSIRTASCSACGSAPTCGLAAKYLARAEARVALLGTGWQAGGQLMAICAVRTIKRIRCFSPNAQRRKDFCTRDGGDSSVSPLSPRRAAQAE